MIIKLLQFNVVRIANHIRIIQDTHNGNISNNLTNKKIQRFVPNTIVIKNPIPDELTKPPEQRLQKNSYIDKNTNQIVTFPRIAAFQIYIFNVLIFSKLKINTWPNHYKILQIIKDIIAAQKSGKQLDQFSVYNQQHQLQNFQQKKPKFFSSIQASPIKARRILSKNKNVVGGSSSKPNHSTTNKLEPYQPKQKSSTIQVAYKRLQPLKDFQKSKKTNEILKQIQKGLQLQKLYDRYVKPNDKNQGQFKLPYIRNKINSSYEKNQRSKIINSLSNIDQFSRDQISIIQNKGSILKNYEKMKQLQARSKNIILYNSNNNSNKNQYTDDQSQEQQNFINNSMIEKNQIKDKSISKNMKNSKALNFDLGYNDNDIQDNELQNMRFVQNFGTQFNNEIFKQTLKNRQMQYQINWDDIKDMGIQLQQKDFPKDIGYHVVQTQYVEILDPQQKARKELLKPTFQDQAIQANIIFKKRQKQVHCQTNEVKLQERQINTDIKQFVTRGYQYPDQEYQKRKIQKIEISLDYLNLYEKRRLLQIDNLSEYYSVDKFQQRQTQLRWLGKAKQYEQLEQIRTRMFIQCMIFSVYNFFGIKTPQKRLAFLKCTNVMGDKITSPFLYHSLSKQLKNVNYLFQFDEFSLQNKKYPLSEQLTFKGNKQKIKFNNWGRFLALMYFLQDTSIFQGNNKNVEDSFMSTNSQTSSNLYSNIAVEIEDSQVKQIYRMNCQKYNLSNIDFYSKKNKDQQRQYIYVDNVYRNFIDVNRLSKNIELQFISMLNHLIFTKTFSQLKEYLKQIFINKSKNYDKQYSKTIESIDLDGQFQEIKQKAKQMLEINEYKEKSISLKLIDEKYKSKKEKTVEIVQSFIRKLEQRINIIQKIFKGKIYTYRKYQSLQAKIAYPTKIEYQIERKINFRNQKQIIRKDLVKYLKNFNNFVILTGQTGSGKRHLINQIQNDLQQNSKSNNVLPIKKIQLINSNSKKFIQQNIKDSMKNYVLVHQISTIRQVKRLTQFIKNILQYSDQKIQVTFLIVIKNQQFFDPLSLKILSFLGKNVLKEQKFIPIKLMPLQNQDIKQYLKNCITSNMKNNKIKDQFIQKIIQNIDNTLCLRNMFYLSLFCKNVKLENLQQKLQHYNTKKITKYNLLKANFRICAQNQNKQLQNMKIKSKNIDEQLKNLILRLYLQGEQALSNIQNQIQKLSNNKINSSEDIYSSLQQKRQVLIKNFFKQFQQQFLIKNQLQFYPIDLKYLIKKNNQKIPTNSLLNSTFKQSDKQKQNLYLNLNLFVKQNNQLFLHQQYYNYLLVETFSTFTEKGYRKLFVNRLLSDDRMTQLIKQRYMQTQSYSELLNNIYQSRTYPSLAEQSSNCMSLLSKLGYVFSNLNFDSCSIPFSDLSLTSFYSCSFKSCNLNKSLMYKTQMINCSLDNAIMDQINLLVKKYDVQFTPLCCALSLDSKTLAVGCGNYLICLSVDTGKQVKKIQAHLDVIRSVNYSKDGKYLITIADDKTLRTWDVTNNYKSVVFKLPQKGTIYYNEQSQMISSLDENFNNQKLKVWNIKSMANESICSEHTDTITSVSYSYHGEYILTGSKDTTLRLWNLEGKQIHLYKGNTKEVICGKISPNNAIILSSSKNKQLSLFHLQSETLINKRQFLNQITQITPDMREKYIIVVFSQQLEIGILNYQTLQIEHKLNGHSNKVFSVNFDLNFEKLITLSKDRTVRIWELKKIMKIQEKQKQNKKKQLSILRKKTINCIAYDKIHKTYVTGHENGSIIVWQQSTNQIFYQILEHQGAVNKLFFDSYSRLYSCGHDGVLRIWEFEKNKKQPIKKIPISSGQLIQMTVNQRNKLIVITSINDQLVIFDFQGIKLMYSTRDQGRINAVAFSNNDKYLAIGGNQKYAVTYKIQSNKSSINNSTSNSGSTLQRFQELGQHPEPITHIVYQGQNFLICALKGGNLYIWNYLKSTLIKKIENTSQIYNLQVFCKKYACFSSQDGRIRFINMEQGKEVKSYRYNQPCQGFTMGNYIQSNEQSILKKNNSIQDSPYMYSFYKDGNIIKWNINQILNPKGSSNNNYGNSLISENSQLQSSPSKTQLTSSPSKKQFLPMNSNINTNSSINVNLRNIKFNRKAVNKQGSLIVQIEGSKQIKIKNLFNYTEQIIHVQNCPHIIEGIGFDEEINKNQLQQNLNSRIRARNINQQNSINFKSIILYLKNGLYWSLYEQKEKKYYKQEQRQQGDLVYIKDKTSTFFRSGIKKVKNIRKPTQNIIDQIS